MLFNKTYVRVNHLIPTVKNQNKCFMKLETLNCVNCSRRNPKRSAKYVYHTGTSASSTARAGTSCEKEQRRIRNSFNTQWISFLFLTTFPTGTVTGRSQETENTTSPIHSRRSAKRSTYLGTHDRFIRDEKFRKNMIDNGRTEEICRQMDDLADEDHIHHSTPEEIEDYRSNWWIRSNKIGSDTMPIQHRSDFKQALSTLRQLKDKEDEAQRNQRWTQSYPSSWWNWQGSWWNSSYESHHEDVPAPIDQGNLIKK